MEQPACRVMVFADVDLLPEEVSGDFAHSALPPRDSVGTEAYGANCTVKPCCRPGCVTWKRSSISTPLATNCDLEGVVTMAPFTDFTYLRQAFTQGEIWLIEPSRLAATRAGGFHHR